MIYVTLFILDVTIVALFLEWSLAFLHDDSSVGLLAEIPGEII